MNAIFIRLPIRLRVDDTEEAERLGIPSEPIIEDSYTYVRKDCIMEFYPSTEEGWVKIVLVNGRDFWTKLPLEKFVQLMQFRPSDSNNHHIMEDNRA